MNKDWQPIEMELARGGYRARVWREGAARWQWLVLHIEHGREPITRGLVQELDQAIEFAEQTIASLQMIVKRCSCGIEYTQEAWDKLPNRGVLDDGVERLEIRNCSCGSSIAVVIGKSEKTT